jgi:hypothetical protein
MEVAAFVLGALPVVLYALDNYQRCLKPVRNHWKYEMTLKQIRQHVYLQQEQLKATMAGLGLDNPTKAQLRDHLRRVYPHEPEKCENFMGILETMDKLLEGMMRDLDTDMHGKVRTVIT